MTICCMTKREKAIVTKGQGHRLHEPVVYTDQMTEAGGNGEVLCQLITRGSESL